MDLIGRCTRILGNTANSHVNPTSSIACRLPIFYCQDGKQFYSNGVEVGRRVGTALWRIIEKEIVDERRRDA